ncbi:MAG: EF-hand domain-containing protein [Pseudomonadota bacterium]
MAALYKPALRTVAACSFAAAALLAAHGAAHAQGTTPVTPPVAVNSPAPGATPRLPTNTEVNAAFDRADENHDARLTRAEADRFPEVARRFEQIDTNKDTFISREEFTKAVVGTP